jgi:glucose-1-phosphate thymidylyltransferase
MKALILAAGYATRLYPLTVEYPKPFLKVGKRPIIDYIIDKIEKIAEIDEVIVVTNSKFFGRFQEWRKKLRSKKQISLVDDLTKDYSDRRGAIGDMNFAINKKRIRDDLLVIGGDNIFDAGLKDFLDFARAKEPHPIIGVYNIMHKAKATKYGVIRLDEEDRIVDFEEKPAKPHSALIAMCLYYFPRAKVKLVRKYLNSRADKHDAVGFYIDWLRRHEKVYGFVFNGRWYDIGHPTIYKEAQESYDHA